MRNILLLYLLIITISSVKLSAQGDLEDWEWQWAEKAEIYNSFRLHKMFTDNDNNFYSCYWYIDSIAIGDTVFRHYGNYPNQQHFDLAIAKFDQNGRFITAVDIYTSPNKSIWMPHMEIGPDSNIVVCGTFPDTVFINQNIITSKHKGYAPNMFIIKLNSDLEFLWSKTISSSVQEFCGGLDIAKDNFIYISSTHAYSTPDTVERMVDYLGQDSALLGTGLNSILKIDINGNLIWRKEVRSFANGYAESSMIICGDNGDIYSIGTATTSFTIDDDTLNHPAYPNWGVASYVVHLNREGETKRVFFSDLNNFGFTQTSGAEVDKNGNYYLAGIVLASGIYGADTITIPPGNRGLIVMKLDSLFQPIWANYVDDYTKINIWFLIDLFEDKLFVAMTGKREFSFAGIDFSFNNRWKGILTQLDTSGNLISHQIIDPIYNIYINKMIADNCGNILVSGKLAAGEAYFGNDTVVATILYETFHAKNLTEPLPELGLPSDTSSCGSLTLYAPEGYMYYRWNNEILNQEYYQVQNSEIVNLQVSNGDGCWIENECNATVLDEILLSLGNDTTILLTDTLEINTSDLYESYLWSTGDTTPNITIPADLLELGNNQIWLEINNGPCYSSDTLNVFVIDNSSISETDKQSIFLYPNPAMNRLYLINRNNADIENVIIYNLSGLEIKRTKPIDTSIDIRELNSGIYIIEIVTEKRVLRQKFIKK